VKEKDILKLRLHNQGLAVEKRGTVKEVVASMGAVQAQDYAMAKWAIGLRLSGTSDAMIEAAINRGDIVRVHIMRPTWHFVAPEDIRWMTTLTAPNIKKLAAVHNKQIGLTASNITKCLKLIENFLGDGEPKTRTEIVEELSRRKLNLDNVQATNVMILAEVEMIACNGPRRNKEFTYALFDSRVPSYNQIDRDEAMRRLTTRYFASHGPATLRDFAWWSGLSNTDVKSAVTMCGDVLLRETVEGQEYYRSSRSPGEDTSKPDGIQLIPPYDEFTVGYANRELVGGTSKEAQSYLGNLIFKPVVINNGKAIGIWRREVKKKLMIEVGLMDQISAAKQKQLVKAVKAYERFLGVAPSEVQLIYNVA
jgi:hypothetical protein